MDQHREMLKKVLEDLLLVIRHVENRRVKKYLRWREERDYEESLIASILFKVAGSQPSSSKSPPPPPIQFFADYDEFLENYLFR